MPVRTPIPPASSTFDHAGPRRVYAGVTISLGAAYPFRHLRRAQPSPDINRRHSMTTPRDAAVINGQETATAARTLQHFVGGRWGASVSTGFGAVSTPATGEVIARGPLGPPPDVGRAVQAAAKAFP